MNYHDTVNWMFQQLPMYQNLGPKGYKIDLSNTYLLADHLGNPERKFKSIHVAGTNGKGSTSHMLASILQEAGYKTGLYTSPHLKDYRERIKIDGKEISEDFVVDFIDWNRSFFETNKLSFFEMTVGMAFQYFSMDKVDIAVIEVGMGGRLDSTNILMPELSVITNIGLDHTAFLGNTLKEIAGEKAGIIKKNIPVVIGETQVETESIFNEIAIKQGSPISFADQENHKDYESDLKGSYQAKNIKTVLQAISILKNLGYDIEEIDIKNGLLNVTTNTGLRGRWDIMQTNPKVILDTAHNKEGLQYVMDQLKSENFNQLHIVFGSVTDKDLDSIIPILPNDAIYYFAKPNVDRGLIAVNLQKKFKEYGIEGDTYTSVKNAYKKALEIAKKDDLIFVGGSTFVVAELIE